jgi:ribonuclease Z
MLDCGAMIQAWTPRIVFLSHTHSDHVHFLSHYFVKRDEHASQSPPTVYLPEEGLNFVKAHLEAYQHMVDCGVGGGSNSKQVLSCSKMKWSDYLMPLKPDQDFMLTQPGNKFRIRTLKMHHRIPCLGYSISRIHSKLKEEYVGLSGKEIGQLNKNGVEITTETEEPFMCFMGDTTADVFELYPSIAGQHSIVVVECSFLDLPSKSAAERTMHTHWDHLQTTVASHPATMFLLTHFSLKYSTLKIRHLFQDLQQTYDNVHPMLVEREVKEAWEKSGEKGDIPRCKCRLCRDNSR